MGLMSYLASTNLHAKALRNVFFSPMSMFDTQPLGRILGVFGKDIDTIDNQLADSFRMMAMTVASVRASLIHRFLAHRYCLSSWDPSSSSLSTFITSSWCEPSYRRLATFSIDSDHCIASSSLELDTREPRISPSIPTLITRSRYLSARIVSWPFVLILISHSLIFYRRSAREVKRLDSLLRGLLYAHFSES